LGNDKFIARSRVNLSFPNYLPTISKLVNLNNDQFIYH
jgi:hypothetical protein